MPTNRSRGGWPSRRASPANRGNNQRHCPNPGKAEAGSSDRHPHSSFEHIPSISRSGGIERDGDTLKDFGVQEEYRDFLQQKLDAYWKRYDPTSSSEDSDAQKSEVESNILIQFRKLREGISSSRRRDHFAIEVYETSLWLSIIFRSHAQTTSILDPLLPDLYLSVTTPPEGFSCLTVLLASLHALDRHYPSQRAFFDLSRNLPPSFAVRDDHQIWLRELSCSLRRDGYSQFRRLTQRTSLVRLVAPNVRDRTHTDHRPGPDLALLSLQTLVAAFEVVFASPRGARFVALTATSPSQYPTHRRGYPTCSF
ncbi:hypothetical protein BC826DRAFT_150297 [Russula brevipes]|nr:hypothetical protein BC826DRAFT_150297 [Russula brevipes]